MADLGIGFLPRFNLVSELRAGQLHEIPIEGVRLARDLRLIFQKESNLTQTGKVFSQVATGNPASRNGKNE
jgi:DNA-binding transcriptional LysR family regulator